MFTGIIEAISRISSVSGLKLQLDSPQGWETEVHSGDSIAINGCCLTVVETGPQLAFDLSEETIAKTNLGTLQPGTFVNLERAMNANGRFDGHIVQGHVECLGQLQIIEEEPGSHLLTFSVPLKTQKWMIEKGSITVNGISLTLFDLNPSQESVTFRVAIIPHTWTATTLQFAKVGDLVNIEFDLIAKYVQRMLATGQA